MQSGGIMKAQLRATATGLTLIALLAAATEVEAQTVFGASASASGIATTAVGATSTAIGSHATAFGHSAEAGENSTAL